jgi:hypothetical protein
MFAGMHNAHQLVPALACPGLFLEEAEDTLKKQPGSAVSYLQFCQTETQ